MYKAVHRKTGELVAVKQTVLSALLPDAPFVRETEKEVALLASVNHPAVVSYLGHCCYQTDAGDTGKDAR